MADRWFMDGNFAMSPSQFQQLYVIRAPLGASAVSCVYALLSGKTQTIYEILLKAVVDKCDAISYSVDPTTVICDFEQAVINAVTAVLGSHITVHGCFYHLTQSTWRKIQELGLTTAYKDDDNVKHFCGMLDALAFLPLTEVAEGMQHIRASIPTGNGLEALVELVDYFDATYVSGSLRRVQRPVTGFNHCVSVALHRCFRRHCGTSTTRRWQTRTVPTTCASRGTADSPVLWATTTRRYGRWWRLSSRTKHWRLQLSSRKPEDSLRSSESSVRHNSCSRDFCRSALLAAIRRKQSSKRWKDWDI